MTSLMCSLLTFCCRSEVVERRARFELAKAGKRLHLVEGYLVAMQNIDEVVNVVRFAADPSAATATLESSFQLSREQAEGVLGLTLRRLTSLEANKLKDEQSDLQTKIADLSDLVQQQSRITGVVLREAEELAVKYATPRRTVIVTEGDSSA
jgi:DNA gyrase subunit A